MPRPPLERVLLVAAVLLPVVLITNAVVSYTDVRHLLRNEAEVIHTYRVLAALQGLVGIVTDAETAHRGFIITGEDSYLPPFWRAPEEVARATQRLDSLVVDRPEQTRRLDVVHSYAIRRLDILSRSLQLTVDEGPEAAREYILEGSGSRAMAALRAAAEEMREAEIEALNERIEASSRAAQRTFLTQILASAVALALLLGLYVLSRRLLQAREALTESLQERSDELEALVQQRTLALSESNERLEAEVVERRRAERSLRAFTLELERSNRELEDFAFIASHDLQEPLRKIQLFGERLQRRHAATLPAEARGDVERISHAAARMRALVNDLLAYARVGRGTAAQDAVPLDGVLADVLEHLEAAIHECGACVEAGPLPTVQGDRTQLGQLLLNLLSNALKFRRMDEVPYIRIRAETGDEQLRLSITDNGIGFDDKYAERIFSPFERLHAAGQYPGTGIGLAVCRRIVEHHGGTITAHGVPGAGATFLVTLPLPARSELHAAPLHDDSHGR